MIHEILYYLTATGLTALILVCILTAIKEPSR